MFCCGGVCEGLGCRLIVWWEWLRPPSCWSLCSIQSCWGTYTVAVLTQGRVKVKCQFSQKCRDKIGEWGWSGRRIDLTVSNVVPIPDNTRIKLRGRWGPMGGEVLPVAGYSSSQFKEKKKKNQRTKSNESSEARAQGNDCQYDLSLGV